MSANLVEFRMKERIDYTLFVHGKQEMPVPVLWEIDGRIKYNRRHPQGAHLYECAKFAMAERQNWMCSICGGRMAIDEASFEHGALRGKFRNDDINAIDAEGFLENSAAHGRCNSKKGSRRDYPMALRLKPEDVQ